MITCQFCGGPVGATSRQYTYASCYKRACRASKRMAMRLNPPVSPRQMLITPDCVAKEALELFKNNLKMSRVFYDTLKRP